MPFPHKPPHRHRQDPKRRRRLSVDRRMPPAEHRPDGDFAARYLSRRYGLPVDRAALIASLAGIGARQ